MLVLSRKANEGVTLYLDGQVLARVVVVRILGDKVRLGFQAPDDVVIDRDEVRESKDRDHGRNGGAR